MEPNIYQRQGWSCSRGQRNRQRRGGVTVVIVALCMTVFFGFAALAVDYGVMNQDANRLQRGCDAGALAGAQSLPSDLSTAKSVARAVALKNSVTVKDSDVTFYDASNNLTNSAPAVKIRVQSVQARAYFFGKAIGVAGGTIARRAVAAVTSPNQLDTLGLGGRVVPLGISKDTYDMYKSTTGPVVLTGIRQDQTSFGLNEMEAYELDSGNGKSGAFFQRQLDGSVSSTAQVNPTGTCPDTTIDCQTSLNASLASEIGKFEKAIDSVFQQSSNSPWNDSDSGAGIRLNDILNKTSGLGRTDNPRIWNMIVTLPQAAQGGTSVHPILAFAPVYIESYGPDDKNAGVWKLTVHFLPSLLMPATGSGAPPGSIMTGSVMIGLSNDL